MAIERSHQIAETPYQVRKRTIYAIEEARGRLEAMLGRIPDWSRLDAFLPERAPSLGDERRTFLASSLSAALELVKDGHAEIRQEGTFEPIYLRPRIRPVPDTPPPAPDVPQTPQAE